MLVKLRGGDLLSVDRGHHLVRSKLRGRGRLAAGCGWNGTGSHLLFLVAGDEQEGGGKTGAEWKVWKTLRVHDLASSFVPCRDASASSNWVECRYGTENRWKVNQFPSP